MNDLLLVFLSLSLSGSILALILRVLQPLTKKRLSRTWQYYIWLIVLLRFLLPITPEVSLMGVLTQWGQGYMAAESVQVPASAHSGERLDFGTQPEYDKETDQGDPLPSGDAGSHQSGTEAAATNPGWDIWTVACAVWLGVALVLIAYKAAAYRSFARFARAGASEIAEGRLYGIWQDELAGRSVKKPLPLFVNSLVSSPMLVGLGRPVVILPPLDASKEELGHILRHELVHYKRRDGLYKWLAQLVLCLHWFNPLAYWIVRQVNRACELSCDEAVVKGMDNRGRVQYGDALMASLKAQGSYSGGVASVTMSEDANSIKERLDAITGLPRKSKAVRWGSAALTFVLLCGFAFTGAYGPSKQGNAGGSGGRATSDRISDPGNRISRGTNPAPEDIENLTLRADRRFFQGDNVEIVIVDDAAVHLAPTALDTISIDYGDTLYDVSMEQKNGDWRIRIAYTGSYSAYPAATLHLPDRVYGDVNLYADQATVYFDGVFRQGGTVNAHLEECSVFYTIPAGFTGRVDAVAPDSYFQLHSEDGYQNCDIAIANCAAFGQLADGFTKQGASLTYRSGAGAGVLRVDMERGGYATVEPGPYGASPASVAAEPPAAGGLTLVEREYTVDQLREGNIQGVKVDVAMENVTVNTVGQTLKLQYYQQGGDDYTLETVSDRGGTINELYLLRNAPVSNREAQREIRITLPEGFACDVVHLTTAGGNIHLDRCEADTVMLNNQGGGDIAVDGGAVRGYFYAVSVTGNINITGTTLPEGGFSNNIGTQSGTVRLRLPGPVARYTYKIDAGTAAVVTIGQQSYNGGSAFTVNGGGAGTITFTSEAGTLLVLDE